MSSQIKNARDLVDWIRQAAPTPTDAYVLGTIASVSPTHVQFDGDITPAGTAIVTPVAMACLGSYTPIIGDRVLMMQVGRTWVILGNLGAI